MPKCHLRLCLKSLSWSTLALLAHKNPHILIQIISKKIHLPRVISHVVSNSRWYFSCFLVLVCWSMVEAVYWAVARKPVMTGDGGRVILQMPRLLFQIVPYSGKKRHWHNHQLPQPPPFLEVFRQLMCFCTFSFLKKKHTHTTKTHKSQKCSSNLTLLPLVFPNISCAQSHLYYQKHALKPNSVVPLGIWVDTFLIVKKGNLKHEHLADCSVDTCRKHEITWHRLFSPIKYYIFKKICNNQFTKVIDYLIAVIFTYQVTVLSFSP